MARRENAALNGKWLSDACPKAIGIRVVEQAKQNETTFESRGQLPGQNLVFQKRAGLTVTIYLKVREIHDLNERMDLITAVNRWAVKGGALSVSYRTGQTLNVHLIQPAAPGDIRSFNDEISLVFASDGWPYWEGDGGGTYMLSGASGFTTMLIPGDAPTPVNVTVYAIKAITVLDITVDGKKLKLTNVNIPQGGYVTLTHDADGVLAIAMGDTNLYPFLDPSSEDCLITSGGSANVSFTTDGDAEVRFSASGRWH